MGNCFGKPSAQADTSSAQPPPAAQSVSVKQATDKPAATPAVETSEEVAVAAKEVPETVAAVGEQASADATARSVAPKKRVLVLYYSMYGHIKTMADAVVRGVEHAGAEPLLYQIPETLPQEILAKMGAPPKSADVPVLTHDALTSVLVQGCDGVIFGCPTRFGRLPAQFAAFLDSLGGLWQGGKLNGKPAAVFTSTGTAQGGQETTVLSVVMTCVHLGMPFVPLGYTKGDVQFDLGEVRGGSPWGAGCYAGGDGGREVSGKELALAEHQGSYFAKFVQRFL